MITIDCKTELKKPKTQKTDDNLMQILAEIISWTNKHLTIYKHGIQKVRTQRQRKKQLIQ